MDNNVTPGGETITVNPPTPEVPPTPGQPATPGSVTIETPTLPGK